MRFTTAFIALLALTPALCAPVPPTEPNTVEALVASAKVCDYSYYHTCFSFIHRATPHLYWRRWAQSPKRLRPSSTRWLIPPEQTHLKHPSLHHRLQQPNP